MLKTQEIKLKNGATLLYTHKENDPFTSITFGIKAGSMHEEDHNRGIAHFIEHMCFNGSEGFTKDELATLPERYGGCINAATHKELTQFDIQVLSKYTKIGIDLATNLVFRPLFDEEYLEKERGIILQELKQRQDNPWCVLYETSDSMFVNSNYKHPIIGYEDTLKKISIDDLIKFHSKHYNTSNLIVSICTDMDAFFITKMLDEILPKDMVGAESSYVEDHTINEKQVINYKEGLTQCKILKFFFIPEHVSVQFEIIDKILGNGLSSRLMKELREKQSLTYQTFSFLDTIGYDIGVKAMYMGITYEDESKTDHIVNEMDRIVNELIEDMTEEEVEQAKAFIKGAVYRSSERSSTIAYSKPLRFMENKDLDLEKHIAKINACTVAELKDTLKRYYTKTYTAILKPDCGVNVEVVTE